jgi:hypothetical protein
VVLVADENYSFDSWKHVQNVAHNWFSIDLNQGLWSFVTGSSKTLAKA